MINYKIIPWIEAKPNEEKGFSIKFSIDDNCATYVVHTSNGTNKVSTVDEVDIAIKNFMENTPAWVVTEQPKEITFKIGVFTYYSDYYDDYKRYR